MVEKEFIDKYKGKTFVIDRIIEKDLSTFVIEVDGHILDNDEEDLFFQFYSEMDRVVEDVFTEIVKWN